MIPSELEITNAVELLKATPARFQRLVEAYAQIQFPERFPHIIPAGRNSAEVTVKGWPDAYSYTPGGGIDAIEMTHSPAWRRHLEKDLTRAAETPVGSLAGFLFVAWAPAPPPESLATYIAQLQVLEVPEDRITFIFKEQLARDLHSPRFAGVLADVLQLRPVSEPFVLLQHAEIFGSLNQPGAFSPTLNEYQQGHVYRISEHAVIASQLDRDGWCFLQGSGSVGKTVAAALVGFERIQAHGTVYYLDACQSNTDTSALEMQRVLEVISTHSDNGVLFIIDNVHIAPKTANRLLQEWRSLEASSHLLLVGRKVSVRASSRGAANPLETLAEGALSIQVTPELIKGVYARLASREVQSVAAVPEPSADVLNKWLTDFKGDLFVFAAAVAQRIRGLITLNWELSPRDAERYVRSLLDPLSPGARESLLIMAALEELDLQTPADVLEIQELTSAIEAGMIVRSEHGTQHRERLSLIHGFGKLLLNSSRDETLITNIWRDVAGRDESLAIIIARRLESRREYDLAREILRNTLGGTDLSATLVKVGLRYAVSILTLANRLGIMSLPEIDEALSSHHSKLKSDIRNQDFFDILHFVKSTFDYLPLTRIALTSALIGPSNQEWLAANMVAEPLYRWPSDFAALSKYLPEAYSATAAALQVLDRRDAILHRLLSAAPDELVTVIPFLKEHLPAIYSSLKSAFRNPETKDLLLRNLAQAPIGHVASLILLLKGRNLRIGLEVTETFVRSGDATKAILDQSDRASLADLLIFFDAVPAEQVLEGIKTSEWEMRWEARANLDPFHFPSCVKNLLRHGRPDLVIPIAKSLVRSADVTRWSQPHVGFEALSHTLRFAPPTEETEARAFLVVLSNSGWLSSRYETTSAGRLAAGLYGIWSARTKATIELLSTRALRARLYAEVGQIAKANTKQLGEILSLLGAAALVGTTIGEHESTWSWPSDEDLIELLRFSAPRTKSGLLGYVQILIWTGMRELVRLKQAPVVLTGELYDRYLTLWKMAEGHTEHQRQLNAWIADWLAKCEDGVLTDLPDSFMRFRSNLDP